VAPGPPVILPAEPTSFIGRAGEIAAVEVLLRRDGVRLVTLIGPGGIGKTRLAMRVGAGMVEEFPDGLCFVALAHLADPDDVAATVAATLDLKEAGGMPLARTVALHLQERRFLLILDSFEHLRPAASFVAELVAACPRLRLLVTSRAALQLSAEHRYEVPPLHMAAAEGHDDAAALARHEAVALFVARARAVRQSFALTDANAPAIAAICRRLDGLPLAIELAAARVRLLPPQTLLQQLESRLAVLVGGARDHPDRQQTLRGTMDWSYQLLSPSEQQLFARLGIFAGGCSLDAVSAIGSPDEGQDVVEAIASLVDNSLVRQAGEDEPRFEMLDTVREYAAERLVDRGEHDSIRRRHAEYFLALAQELEPALTGAEQSVSLARLDMELDNLRGALGWLLQQDRSDEAVLLAGAMYAFWLVRGRCSEGRRWLEDGLSTGSDLAEEVRAGALWRLGGLAVQLGDHERGTPLLEEALALFGQLGDAAGRARALSLLGVAAWRHGDFDRAATLLEEGLRLATQVDDQRERAYALLNLGIAVYRGGDHATGRRHLQDALALNRARGDRQATLHALINLGYDSTLVGDLDAAEAMFAEVLATARDLGIRQFVAYALENLATISTLRGKHEQAASQLRETLVLGRELGDQYLLVFVLAGLAKVEIARGRPGRAARLGSAVAALQGPLGITMAPEEDRDREEVIERAREQLGEAPFREAWESGQVLSLEVAVAGALDDAE
jgi:non-specific serine/threonine protein kinase